MNANGRNSLGTVTHQSQPLPGCWRPALPVALHIFILSPDMISLFFLEIQFLSHPSRYNSNSTFEGKSFPDNTVSQPFPPPLTPTPLY